MSKTVIKSARLLSGSFHILNVIFVIFTGGLTYFSFRTNQFGVMTVLLCVTLFNAWLVWISPTTCDVATDDSGGVSVVLSYFGRSLRWTGRMSDIERISHQTFDGGEGDLTSVVLIVKNVGAISLWQWNLRKAAALGNALGIGVQDERVDVPIPALRRSKLFEKLGPARLKFWFS
jgi:hypothetical protein